MKAKKLCIRDYELEQEVTQVDEKTGEQVTKKVTYQVVASLVQLLVNPRLALPVGDYLDATDLARRLKTARLVGDENVLLDSKEYELLKNAVSKFPGQTQQGPVGFSESDAELVSRVLRIEEVEVDESAVLKMPTKPIQ